MPPKDWKHYFDPSSDDEFKAAHPVGYFFFVMLSIIALFLPCILLFNAPSTMEGYYQAAVQHDIPQLAASK